MYIKNLKNAFFKGNNTIFFILSFRRNAFDKAVDLCYRPQAFVNETKRIEFLFELYDKIESGCLAETGKEKN